MFSYDHLLAFCTTYETQGYSAAAKKLNKDRTTIRDQVKALEETYRVSLFDIVGKKASPTKAAEHIYQRAKVIINNTEKLNNSLDSIFCEKLLQLDIYHDISLPLSLAIKIEHALAKRFPELRLHWLHRNRTETISTIEQSPHSIALMQHRSAQDTNRMVSFYALGYGELGIYCGKRSRLLHFNHLSMNDLKLEKQYISENHFKTLPAMYSVSPHYHLISNNDLLLEMVKYDGWAIMSIELAEAMVKSGDLFELSINELAGHFNFGLSLFYPVTLEQDPALDLIKQVSKAHFS